ncbi:MAG: sulfite exporter TauE/SafE family protein [Rhodospirillales bacterium]|nr:MAG: sulfite exporter TauE/SafE family protein [Rhodospirillales bacterium]
MGDHLSVVIIAGTFLLAGVVKGVIGLGLPTISLALLTMAIGLPGAMNLLLVPSFITNLWQALAGGHAQAALRRTWPFLLMATTTVWFGAGALTRVDLSLLSALLGALLVVYAASSLVGLQIRLTVRQAAWVGPVAGAVNGVLAGMTGSFVVPGVVFLQALGLPRDMLVQAMGMLFAASTLALAFALQRSSLLSAELGMLSAAALLPAILGMVIGQRLRKNLSEERFRRIFYVALLLLGAYIFVNALQAALQVAG